MSTIDPQEIEIRTERTPNPASVRFVVDRTLIETGTVDLNTPEKAERSPLAKRLFALLICNRHFNAVYTLCSFIINQFYTADLLLSLRHFHR